MQPNRVPAFARRAIAAGLKISLHILSYRTSGITVAQPVPYNKNKISFGIAPL
jgi:hypothetical protein